MPHSPEAIIKRIPQWKNAADLNISVLSGGITNRNYRVETGGEVFVLRISGEKTDLLGIDREQEYIANRAAAGIGIAPEVVHFIRPEGYLVTRFVEGEVLSKENLSQPEMIILVAKALRRIHALPAIEATFSPFRVVETYKDTARQHHVAFPADFDWMLGIMWSIEESLLKAPFSPRLCHNDLLTENFLDDGDLRILDWEYAGMGDVFFDLANFAAHHELSETGERVLLETYFDEVTSPRIARLQLMKIMSDFRESMWGTVQVGISSLDFDFRGYADGFFAQMRNRMKDPQLKGWLEEAKENV